MLFLLGLVALGGLFLLVLVLAVMHAAGWRVTDARDVALNRAYGSFTHDGVLIPGVRPNALTRFAIRVLSDEDRRTERARGVRDARRAGALMRHGPGRNRTCARSFEGSRSVL